MNKSFRIISAGLLGGFLSEGFLGALFMSPFLQKILYNPEWQSELFRTVTVQRDLVPSVVGITILSIFHSWLYTVFFDSIPGKTWVKKGLFWGLTIWIMFWLFQEWFIYHTLLAEPILLNILELIVLLLGSLLEGIVIAFFFRKEADRS